MDYEPGQLWYDTEHDDYVVITEVYQDEEELVGTWAGSEEEAIEIYREYLNTIPRDRYNCDSWTFDEYPMEFIRTISFEPTECSNWKERIGENVR